MPGAIQSIERAAAVLRLLGNADRALGLRELAAALDLPRPTTHGIVRTLYAVGLVDQDPETARYLLGDGLLRLHRGLDGHDLRAAAMNWPPTVWTGGGADRSMDGEGGVAWWARPGTDRWSSSAAGGCRC